MLSLGPSSDTRREPLRELQSTQAAARFSHVSWCFFWGGGVGGGGGGGEVCVWIWVCPVGAVMWVGVGDGGGRDGSAGVVWVG